MRPAAGRLPVLLFIVYLSIAAVAGRTDPATGRVRLLHIGLAFLRPDHPDPVFFVDPKIDLTMVPVFSSVMQMAEMRRMMRLYLPRTKDELDGNFDLVLMDGADAFDVRDEFLRWTTELVQNGNMSFVMSDAGSGWSFAGSGPSWYITSIEPILTVDDSEGREAAMPGYSENNYGLVPVDPNHELMRNIPWGEMRFIAMNRPTERLGATVIARMSDENPVNRGKPVIAYWDYPSGGRSASYILTWHTMVDTAWILAFYRWEWHYDVLVHMVYWPAGEPIPADIALVHRVRQLFSELYYSKVLVLSVVDFAERVGANLRQIELEIGKLDTIRRQMGRLYVQNQMEECYDLSLGLESDYQDLIDRTMRAKDRALFWIFVIEWLVVSATLMVAGVVLWVLMVKRRLYREVRQTRLLQEG